MGHEYGQVESCGAPSPSRPAQGLDAAEEQQPILEHILDCSSWDRVRRVSRLRTEAQGAGARRC